MPPLFVIGPEAKTSELVNFALGVRDRGTTLLSLLSDDDKWDGLRSALSLCSGRGREELHGNST